jgi:hypothetical protein
MSCFSAHMPPPDQGAAEELSVKSARTHQRLVTGAAGTCCSASCAACLCQRLVQFLHRSSSPDVLRLGNWLEFLPSGVDYNALRDMFVRSLQAVESSRWSVPPQVLG